MAERGLNQKQHAEHRKALADPHLRTAVPGDRGFQVQETTAYLRNKRIAEGVQDVTLDDGGLNKEELRQYRKRKGKGPAPDPVEIAVTTKQKEAAQALEQAVADEKAARAELSEAIATGQGEKVAQTAYAKAVAHSERSRLAQEHLQREAERKAREEQQQKRTENRERCQLQAAEMTKKAADLQKKLDAFMNALGPVVAEMEKLRAVCHAADLPTPPRCDGDALTSEVYKTLVMHPDFRFIPDPHGIRHTPQLQHYDLPGWAERITQVVRNWTDE